jgi:hypothetical protein
MDPPQMAGSTLTIDSISFLHSSQPFPNGDFENWTTITTDQDPDGWGTYANQFPYYQLPVLVTKTADAHSGSFAVKLISDTATAQPPFGSGVPGDTILGTLQLNMINGFFSTKYPFAFRPDSVTGYVKSIVAALPDNFNVIWIELSNNNNPVGQAVYYNANSVNNYIRFSVNFNYSSGITPDSMTFVISAGNPGNPVPGNVFYVDDLSFVYDTPPGIKDNPEISTFKIYPNPVKDDLNILTQSREEAIIKIYNANGVMVKQLSMNKNLTTITISDLPKGLYLYQITDRNENIPGSGKFIIE